MCNLTICSVDRPNYFLKTFLSTTGHWSSSIYHHTSQIGALTSKPKPKYIIWKKVPRIRDGETFFLYDDYRHDVRHHPNALKSDTVQKYVWSSCHKSYKTSHLLIFLVWFSVSHFQHPGLVMDIYKQLLQKVNTNDVNVCGYSSVETVFVWS